MGTYTVLTSRYPDRPRRISIPGDVSHSAWGFQMQVFAYTFMSSSSRTLGSYNANMPSRINT